MNLVKWGGSLITDKTAAKPTPQRERITALAAALAANDVPAVLVHGAGSFGHPLAKRFGLAQGSDGSPEQAAAVARTRQQVRTLNALVCEALATAGLEPVPILPSQTLRTAGPQNIVDFPASSFEAALKAGRIPVTCGDVTDDDSQGIAILSGDTLMLALARALRPQRALFVINHSGVMDRDPAEPGAKLIAHLNGDARTEMRAQRMDVPGADVTGGMWGKLEAAAAIARECECRIIGAGGFAAALTGDSAGTLVLP
ncbi:MAG: isopentenyl phosphate kinase [Candidatus Poseidoniia archaeon]